MKKLILLLAVFTAVIAKADTWDNMTKAEADVVVEYLKKNPFVFDYCDCCGTDATPKLLHLQSYEIVPCEWKPEDFSVKYSAAVIAEFSRNDEGISIGDFKKVDAVETGVISMNYTWGWNYNERQVLPFFTFVDYDMYGLNSEPCLKAFALPDAALVGHKKYKKWSKKKK